MTAVEEIERDIAAFEQRNRRPKPLAIGLVTLANLGALVLIVLTVFGLWGAADTTEKFGLVLMGVLSFLTVLNSFFKGVNALLTWAFDLR